MISEYVVNFISKVISDTPFKVVNYLTNLTFSADQSEQNNAIILFVSITLVSHFLYWYIFSRLLIYDILSFILAVVNLG